MAEKFRRMEDARDLACHGPDTRLAFGGRRRRLVCMTAESERVYTRINCPSPSRRDEQKNETQETLVMQASLERRRSVALERFRSESRAVMGPDDETRCVLGPPSTEPTDDWKRKRKKCLVVESLSDRDGDGEQSWEEDRMIFDVRLVGVRSRMPLHLTHPDDRLWRSYPVDAHPRIVGVDQSRGWWQHPFAFHPLAFVMMRCRRVVSRISTRRGWCALTFDERRTGGTVDGLHPRGGGGSASVDRRGRRESTRVVEGCDGRVGTGRDVSRMESVRLSVVTLRERTSVRQFKAFTGKKVGRTASETPP